MFINTKNTILSLRSKEHEMIEESETHYVVDHERKTVTVEVNPSQVVKALTGRPKKKKEPITTLKGRELMKNVPFIKGDKSSIWYGLKKYCDHCIERDGEEYKDQTCSYMIPATANKSQWSRNHVAMNECPNCHEDLGIECLDWETLPTEKKK